MSPHGEVFVGATLIYFQRSVTALRVILSSAMTHLSGFASLNKQSLAPHDTIKTIIKTQFTHTAF
ncbi:hypothetical protein BDR06DRAFT_964356 [Suillus hirtellus]|nr:hypothetical protein BDR06DRAFT_964356 [Suillus hirtellus]